MMDLSSKKYKNVLKLAMERHIIPTAEVIYEKIKTNGEDKYDIWVMRYTNMNMGYAAVFPQLEAADFFPKDGREVIDLTNESDKEGILKIEKLLLLNWIIAETKEDFVLAVTEHIKKDEKDMSEVWRKKVMDKNIDVYGLLGASGWFMDGEMLSKGKEGVEKWYCICYPFGNSYGSGNFMWNTRPDPDFFDNEKCLWKRFFIMGISEEWYYEILHFLKEGFW